MGLRCRQSRRVDRLPVEQGVDLRDAVRLLRESIADTDALQQLLLPGREVVRPRMRSWPPARFKDSKIDAMMRERAGGSQADRPPSDDDYIGIKTKLG